MALVFYDRVRETTTVTGTSDATLLGAVTGFQAFSVVGNGNTCYYTIADQSGGNWECGIGTYSTTGPTLQRTTILSSSNSGNKVSFGAGTKDVFLTYPSEKAAYLDESDYLGAGGSSNISLNGNLTFVGARRILGDFSNATIANRVMFQTSTTNVGSNLGLLPNGTAGGAFWNTYGSSDPTNAAEAKFGITGNSEVTIRAAITGTGTYLPMTFHTGGSERLRIDTSGNVGIGGTPTATSGSGNLLIAGYGVQPYLSSDGATSSTQNAAFAIQNTVDFALTGAASGQLNGMVVTPGMSNTGAGGTNQAFQIGAVVIPRITSSGSTARVTNTGLFVQSARGYAADTSATTANGLTGTTSIHGHLATLPSTAITGTSTGYSATGFNLSGSITNLYNYVGTSINLNPSTGSVTTTNVAHLFFNGAAIGTSTGTSTITNYWGLRVAGPTIGTNGTVTSHFGLDLTAPTVTGTLTNNWGIYQRDANATNYFNGKVGIGATSVAQKLQIGVTGSDNYIQFGTLNEGYVIGRENSTGDFLFNATQASPFNVYKWQQGGTERMRIDTSGNVGIGTGSSGTFRLNVADGSSATRLWIYNTANAAGGAGIYMQVFNGASVVADNTIRTDNAGNMAFFTGTTSGSERMRISSTGLVGIGTSSPSNILTVDGGFLEIRSGNALMIRPAGNANDTRLVALTTNGLDVVWGGTPTTSMMHFSNGSTIGIGTSSPGGGSAQTKLQVVASNISSLTTQANVMITTNDAQGVDIGAILGIGGSVTTAAPNNNMRLFGAIKGAKDNSTDGATSGYMSFLTMGAGTVTPTERMRIDSSGRVGIGTSSPIAKFQVNFGTNLNIAFAEVSSISTIVGINDAGSGTIPLRLDGSDLRFATAGTEAMRIVTGGNVGIGTTTPAAKLDVVGTIAASLSVTAATTSSASLDSSIMLNLVESGAVGEARRLNICLLNGSGASAREVYFRGILSSLAYAGDSYHRWLVGGNERMRIDSSGNVGIGTSDTSNQRLKLKQSADTGAASFSFKVEANANDTGLFLGYRGVGAATAADTCAISASYTSTGAFKPITFLTSDTERMRIDSSGNLLVGTTSTNPIASRVDGFATGPVGFLTLRAANNMALGVSGNTGSHIAFYTDNGSAFVTAGAITSNGSTTTYGTGSDYRMKTDIKPMVGGLNRVMKLKPVTYKWKDEFAGTNPDGEGFIAHELQEHCPNAVTGEKDEVNEDGSIKPQRIDTSFLIATLTAAIQEQQAMIEELKQEVAKLKGV